MQSEPSYKRLRTYQQAEWIYYLTKEFTKTYLHPIRDSRLISQMNDAGRSVVRNIAEGGKRKGLKDYIEFLSFSRSSLEELLGDFIALAQDYKAIIWDKDDVRFIRLRWWIGKRLPYQPFQPYLPNSFEHSINIVIDLIIKTNYMLDNQIKSLETKFIQEGGYSENLANRRRNYRNLNLPRRR